MFEFKNTDGTTADVKIFFTPCGAAGYIVDDYCIRAYCGSMDSLECAGCEFGTTCKYAQLAPKYMDCVPGWDDADARLEWACGIKLEEVA